MSFTEYVMKAGAWSLRLSEDTPLSILADLRISSKAYSQIVILPAPLDPETVTDAAMLSLARYTGIYTRKSDSGLMLGGPGLSAYLGNELDGGDIRESAITTAAGTLAQWFAALVDDSLTNGTCETVAGSWYPNNVGGGKGFYLVNRFQAWAQLCAAFGVEWRITPAGVFNVATVDTMYGTTPKGIILGDTTPIASGRDRNLVGLRGSATRGDDYDEFATKVIHRSGDFDNPYLATATRAVTFRSIKGNLVIHDRVVDGHADFSEPPVDAADQNARAAVAAGALNNLGARTAWTVVGGAYDFGRIVPVGAPLWLYDPARSVYDVNNVVEFAGTTVYPIKKRLMGMTTPITAGMGVYLRTATSTSTATWMDLTPYVEFEKTTQRLEVGAVPRPSRRRK